MADPPPDTGNGKLIGLIADDLFAPLPEKDKPADEIVRVSKTFAKDAWDRFKRNPLAMTGLVIIAVIVAGAVLGPALSAYTYEKQDIANQYLSPSWAHFFGTDKFGRDLFVRTMYGARISLAIGFCAAAINLLIGVIYGGVAGYFGGKLDIVMMRIVDIIYGIPQVCYVILIMLYLGASIYSILIAISVTYWIRTARVVRSQVLTLKSQEFILAARSIGESDFDIIAKHLIPNCLGPIVVTVTFLIPDAIFLEAYLSFLGIGIQVPMASWGTLANDAIPELFSHPMLMIFPAVLISVTMFALNFIGDGMRDALDPKFRK